MKFKTADEIKRGKAPTSDVRKDFEKAIEQEVRADKVVKFKLQAEAKNFSIGSRLETWGSLEKLREVLPSGQNVIRDFRRAVRQDMRARRSVKK